MIAKPMAMPTVANTIVGLEAFFWVLSWLVKKRFAKKKERFIVCRLLGVVVEEWSMEGRKRTCGKLFFYPVLALLFLGFEYLVEHFGYGRVKAQVFVGDGVVEIEAVGVQAEAVARVVTIAILDVATNRVSQILQMHTNLVLTPSIEAQFYEAVGFVLFDTTIVSARKFPPIIQFGRASDVVFTIFEIAFDDSLFL